MKAYAFHIQAAHFGTLIIPIIAPNKRAAFQMYNQIKRNSTILITFLKYSRI